MAAAVKQRLPAISVLYQKMHYLHFLKQDWDFYRGAGGTQRLARLIGLGRAQDVILLGRKIGGPEAVQIGLATKCVPKTDLMAEAKKMASKLIAKGPVAIRIAKRVVQASMSSSQDVGELLEMLALSTLCSTEDKLEGVSSF